MLIPIKVKALGGMRKDRVILAHVISAFDGKTTGNVHGEMLVTCSSHWTEAGTRSMSWPGTALGMM
jgi:hypothetical protein